jgi:hypothetical protein
MIRNLLADGIIGRVQNHGRPSIALGGTPLEIFVALTPKGKGFLRRWQDSERLDR